MRYPDVGRGLLFCWSWALFVPVGVASFVRAPLVRAPLVTFVRALSAPFPPRILLLSFCSHFRLAFFFSPSAAISASHFASRFLQSFPPRILFIVYAVKTTIEGPWGISRPSRA